MQCLFAGFDELCRHRGNGRGNFNAQLYWMDYMVLCKSVTLVRKDTALFSMALFDATEISILMKL